MKVDIKKVYCVFAWSWQIPNNANETEPQIDDEYEDELCGICRASFNRACPNCKFPGDGCPLVVSECHHNFHVHCIYEWLDTANSKGLCPMCRQDFQLRKGLSINQSQISKFNGLILKRKQEQTEFDGNMDDEAIARAIADQEGIAGNLDNQGDVIMDQDLIVR